MKKPIVKTILTLHPKQSLIMESLARFKVIRAGRRFGKSTLAIAAVLDHALKNANSLTWIISSTYKQVKTICWRMLKEYTPHETVKKILENELTIELNNGSRIELKGSDNRNSLRGVGLSLVVLDEMAFMDSDVLPSIISPMLIDSPNSKALMISTPLGFNHFWKIYEEAANKKGWERWHFTSYDNPYLDRNEIDEKRKTMSDLQFQQEFLGEFARKTGTVFEGFNRDAHVVFKRLPNKENAIYLSIDWGFGKGHPCCVQMHEINSVGEIYTFDGFMRESLTIEQMTDAIRSMTAGLTIRGVFADSARPDLIDAFTRQGFAILPTNKDRELGIAKVAEYMQVNPVTGKPRWTIANHLADMIRQIEDYSYEPVRGDDNSWKQLPSLKNNDACDCLRYLIFNYIDKTTTQDFVYEEWQPRESLNQKLYY
jgi:phage terminase large subunit